jgi:hypothetical protein
LEVWIKSFCNLLSRQPIAKQRITIDAIDTGVEAMPVQRRRIFKETSILSLPALKQESN